MTISDEQTELGAFKISDTVMRQAVLELNSYLNDTRMVYCRCWDTCKNHQRHKSRLFKGNSLGCTLKEVAIDKGGRCANFTPGD